MELASLINVNESVLSNDSSQNYKDQCVVPFVSDSVTILNVFLSPLDEISVVWLANEVSIDGQNNRNAFVFSLFHFEAINHRFCPQRRVC